MNTLEKEKIKNQTWMNVYLLKIIEDCERTLSEGIIDITISSIKSHIGMVTMYHADLAKADKEIKVEA